MELTKRLVILSGKTGQGTALIERNGMGTFVTLNVFSLPDLPRGEYVLGVKTPASVYRRELGSLGKIKARFSLPDGDYTAVHLVLFRNADEQVVLYGTSRSQRMWEANLMDGLRGERLEQTAASDARQAQIAATEEFRYSERKIEDYFLDIDPTKYYDNAVAEINYYDYVDGKEQERSEADSADEGTGERDETQPSDGDGVPAAGAADVSPSELTQRYLHKRFEQSDGAQAYAANNACIADERADNGEDAQHEGTDEPKPIGIKQDAGESKPIDIKKASSYTVEQAVAAVKTDAGFYDTVKASLDKLFAEHEPFAPLNEALPDTQWVKVDYDASGRYYVVGLIGTPPQYIAYGVEGTYGDTPPLLDGADFVPLFAAEPAGKGFWVLFQSAQTGEEIVRKG